MSENATQEIKADDISSYARLLVIHLKSKWKTVMIYALCGALIGLACSWVIKPKFTAVCTFVLEDNEKDGMLAQYAGLASLAGIDMAGGSSGIFKGNNILELYKSRSMLEKTLLTQVMLNGKKQLLIDRYIQSNNLKEKWLKDDDIRQINFNGDAGKFGRKQDSLITDLSEIFNKRFLDVSKPDKKLSIIRVAFTSKDELFAKAFADQLVANVNRFYVETKTKKSAQNVQMLQLQADSVRRVLNGAMYGVATAIDAAPNANPALVALRVPSQKKQVDVQTNTAIYSEVVKNLELSKMSLRQQTPLIQFIDQPVLPLAISKIGKLKGVFFGALFGVVLAFMVIIARRVFQAFN